MRKTILALSAAAALAATAASPAAANPRHHHHHQHHGYWSAPAVGAVAGTVAGVGFYNGWWGSSGFATTVGSTTAGSIAGGVLVGAGTAALIHAATTPCQGFHALFGGSGCVNGRYVGHMARR